jgi:hypothetical protein
MATVYHRDQAGAPALAYGPNLGFAAIKEVLKACLIYGYGSVAPAGWSLIAEGANHLVLRNGSESGYVCLSWNGQFAIRVYLAQTFTGVVADVITGDGVKTGVASGNTVPQAFGSYFPAFHTASSTWSMVADERSFMLCVEANGVSTPGNLGVTSEVGGVMLYAGEDSEGNFISVGGNATATTANNAALYVSNFAMVAGVTVLKDPVTGLLVGGAAISVASPGLVLTSSALPLAQNSSPYPELVVSPIVWSGGGSYAGRLRGVVLAANMPFMYRGGIAAALGRTGIFSSRNCSVPFNDLGDGRDWVILTGNDTMQGAMLMTTNEDYW